MKGFLVLETGETFPGNFLGGSNRAGEVVFNTSHSGYEEIATDPSYFKQIVLMTAPMQGNYGIDSACWESRKIWIEGFICLRLQKTIRDSRWLELLSNYKIPCLSNVDTRKLTLHLRDSGTVWGALVSAASETAAKNIAAKLIKQAKDCPKDWVYEASRRQKEIIPGDIRGGKKIAVMDFGCKENILRELKKRSSELIIFNSRANADEILSENPDGLMLTNGPGDPSDVESSANTVRSLIGRLPIFGICMGHQILGISLGAKTYKLKFGHRGSNHPIRDGLLNKIYMTSQNHGYAIDKGTLPEDAVVTHINLNDGTVAGIFSEEKKYLGIQYHPESHPGPHEAAELFDFFINRMLRG